MWEDNTMLLEALFYENEYFYLGNLDFGEIFLSFQSKTSQLLKKNLLNSDVLRCLEFENSISTAFAQDHMDQAI